LLALTVGCFGLSEQDEQRWAFFHENSLAAYERGDYLRALHQANQALFLDEDDVPMQLIKGFCLLKLGTRSGNAVMIDESLGVFDELADTSAGKDDFRVYVGLGSAHLARALETDDEIAEIEERLRSDFLSEDSRAAEQRRLARTREQRLDHLSRAETSLRRVLAFELQKDNLFALMDLVLTLNSMEGRQEEALPLAEQALSLLDESTRFTRNTLELNTRLSPAARIDLQQRIETNDEKERLLRDLIATVHFNRGDMEGFLEQMTLLEERGLMGEAQHYNRATVHEALGDYEAAIRDLEDFLRLRSRRLDFEQDEMAPEIFERIEQLRAADGGQVAR
jgi:tetratricopeptide (TPR) repeat protein